MKKILPPILVCVFILTVLLLLGRDKVTQSVQQISAPQNTQKVTLALSNTSAELSALIVVADEKGFFKNRGVDLQLMSATSSNEVAQDIETRKADLGAFSDYVFVLTSLEAGNTRVIASINRSGQFELLARKDRGILEQKDIKGKKIAYTKRTVVEYFFAKFLEFYDMSTNDIQSVSVPTDQIIAALKSGQIDAAVSGEPTITQAKEALGDNLTHFPVQGNQKFYWLLVGNQDFVSANPQTADNIVRALVDAETFIEQNRIDAQEIVAKRSGRDISYIRNSWNTRQFTVDLPQSLLIQLKVEAEWAVAHNLAPTGAVIPDYKNLIYSDALAKVKPEAVLVK